ncbi:hypothetical protein [Polaromonas sp. DSP2-3-2b2]|uniref:hypothetical protein n=1 Tax=Polaromonas sp. DSP2-3-2b2 TaxID=2804662 RepID=UPI003CEC8D26
MRLVETAGSLSKLIAAHDLPVSANSSFYIKSRPIVRVTCAVGVFAPDECAAASAARLVNFQALPGRPMAARLSGLVNIVIHSFAHRKGGQACAALMPAVCHCGLDPQSIAPPSTQELKTAGVHGRFNHAPMDPGSSPG